MLFKMNIMNKLIPFFLKIVRIAEFCKRNKFRISFRKMFRLRFCQNFKIFHNCFIIECDLVVTQIAR